MPASSPAAPTVEFVRPGPAALHWLRETIAALKAGDPLRPVTLIVPNYNTGLLARYHLARSGGYVNLRVLQLREYAETLAARSGLAHAVLNEMYRASAIRAALAGAAALKPVADHPSLQSALATLFGELRRQELDAEGILANETSETARAALNAYRRYGRINDGYLDQTGVRDLAASWLETAAPDELADFGALIVLLPPRLDPVDVRLLTASARFLPLRVALPFFGDLLDGDQQALASASGLAAALAIETSLPPASGPFPPAIVENVRVVRAPSPSDEVCEAIRRVAEDLEHEVPLHQMAILYRQDEPYAALVRESLDLAGIRWVSRRGVSESLPGRALASLLSLPAQNFARGAVIGWFDIISGSAGPGPSAPALWDRIAREAGATAGLEQWQRRLTAHAAGLREQIEDGEARGLSRAARERLDADAVAALDLAARVRDLGRALQSPRDGRPWGDFVDWLLRLWQEQCGGDEVWPAEEQPFARLILPLIERLRDGGRFQEKHEGPTLALFVATVQSALANQARPVRRLGEGLLIGPVQSVNGLAFERVHILGLTEGSFPPRPPLDPFFPHSDPLRLAERRRAEERRSFLTALASADGGRVTLYTSNSLTGRPAFPSRYLLEVAALRLGRPSLDTATFRELRPDEHPWLRVIASAEEAAERARSAADVEDLRVGRAIRWIRCGRSLQQQPRALDATHPLGAALAMLAGRRGSGFTVYDGNLAGAGDDLQHQLGGPLPTSTSAVERWAVCPFRYFLADILRVRPTPRPEEAWSIDPGERGTLVHKILYEFFKWRQSAGVPVAADLTAAEHTALEAVAAQRFEQTVDRGLAGHPLIWESATAGLLADLGAFLSLDARRRSEEGLVPVALEAPFGSDPAGWPPVEVNVAGAGLRFRGVIDRVDAGQERKTLEILDYKTGGYQQFNGLAADPVLAGRHLQLALYLLAARQALGGDDLRAAYQFVTSRGGFRVLSLPDDIERVEQRLFEVLEQIVAGVRGGYFPQVPGDETDSRRNCLHCDFDRICPSDRDAAWRRKSDADAYRLHARLKPAEPVS